MQIRLVDVPSFGKQNYSMAAEVSGPGRLLFVSGQVPEAPDGRLPREFADQAMMAWHNLEETLTQAGMTLRDLVKVTVFLSDRAYRDENTRVREKVLGDHKPAITVIVTGIYDERWLLEIEAIAAA